MEENKTSIGSIIATIIIIALIVLGGLYFWGKRIEQQQAVQSFTPATTTVVTLADNQNNVATTTDWKTYNNTKYGYSIKYPQGWYLYADNANNNIFCGGPNNTDCYGGTLNIASDAYLKDYIPNGPSGTPLVKTPPADFANFELDIIPLNSTMVYKSCEVGNGTPITINGLHGQTCIGYQSDMPSGNVKVTYVNGSTYQFRFNYRPYTFIKLNNIPANIIQTMDSIIQTFQATK